MKAENYKIVLLNHLIIPDRQHDISVIQNQDGWCDFRNSKGKKKISPVTKTHQEILKSEQTFKCQPYRSVTFNELLPAWMDLCLPVLGFSVSCGKRRRLLSHGNTSDDWAQIPTSKQINLLRAPVWVLTGGRAQIRRQREACVESEKEPLTQRVSKHPLKRC